MQIVVACRDGETVAGYIGKCMEWIMFEVTENDSPESDYMVTEVERIKLTKHFVFHHYKDDGSHPLESCKAVLRAGASIKMLMLHNHSNNMFFFRVTM